jgi:hypothetical protein
MKVQGQRHRSPCHFHPRPRSCSSKVLSLLPFLGIPSQSQTSDHSYSRPLIVIFKQEKSSVFGRHRPRLSAVGSMSFSATHRLSASSPRLRVLLDFGLLARPPQLLADFVASSSSPASCPSLQTAGSVLLSTNAATAPSSSSTTGFLPRRDPR